MPRILIVALFLFALQVSLFSQIYHHKTGKVLHNQKPNKIDWKEGVYNTYPADYGTLIVEENRHTKDSRLIYIPIIRIKALNPNSTQTPLFLLNGGPGESNFQTQLFFDKLAYNRDIVLVGYRGVDGSENLDCPCMKRAILSDTITTNNASTLFQIALDSCLMKWHEDRIDINGYSMDEVVGDIEITRKAIGYSKISLLSFSYGTMLSQLYHKKHPLNIDKMLLLGARPLNDFIFDSDGFNNQILLLFEKYNTQTITNNSDSINLLLTKIDNSLNTILNNNRELNSYRFMFFILSKLYSIDNVGIFYSDYINAVKGSSNKLIKQYNEFYKNFPGDITAGDIVLKKQGRVSFKDISTATFGDKITNTLNSWYTPNIELLINTKELQQLRYNDSVEVLFISGEFDVASPPHFFESTDNLGYINSTKIIIPDAGHIDLFYSKKYIVEEAVVNFFIE